MRRPFHPDVDRFCWLRSIDQDLELPPRCPFTRSDICSATSPFTFACASASRSSSHAGERRINRARSAGHEDLSSHHRPEDLPSHRRSAFEVGRAPLMRFMTTPSAHPGRDAICSPEGGHAFEIIPLRRSLTSRARAVCRPLRWSNASLRFSLARSHVIASRSRSRAVSRSSVRRGGVARCGGRRVGHPTVFGVPRDAVATANRFV